MRRAATLSFARLCECYATAACLTFEKKREVTEGNLAEAVELFASAARCPCAATPGRPSASETGDAASVHIPAKAAAGVRSRRSRAWARLSTWHDVQRAGDVPSRTGIVEYL